jgi:protein ImuB
MFAVIYIPNFELQSVLRHEPGWQDQPVLLIDGEVDEAVFQCSAAAQPFGIEPGMTSPQAMARCPQVIIKTRSSAQEQSATEILLQCAYSFSPRIEATAPGVCTLDLQGVPVPAFSQAGRHPLPQGEGTHFARGEQTSPISKDSNVALPANTPSSWADKILAALSQFNLHAQIGIAATPLLALHAARAAAPFLQIHQATEFVSALPIEFLQPSPNIHNLLRRWGIRNVGAFLALGKDRIAERLGPEALELFDAASTEAVRPLQLVVPTQTFAESADFEVEIESLEPLMFILRRFIEQLSQRLELIGQVPQLLQLRLKLSSGEFYENVFTVPAPTGDVEILFRMLQTHLENVRTSAAIVSVQLSAKPCRARTHQFGLFEVSLRDPNQFDETLARLSALCGPHRVGTPILEGSYRPDAFRMESPDFSKALEPREKPLQSSGTTGLCLRRFRPAFHADVEVREGRPVFISTLKFTSPITDVRGPWRGSGNWWEQEQLWKREEWDIQTRDGIVYRIFQTRDDWFLEGVYD